MIDIGDILTLSDGNEYLVTNKAKRKGKKYYLLVCEEDLSNIKFCYEDKKGKDILIVEVDDKKLIRELMLRFTKNMFTNNDEK